MTDPRETAIADWDALIAELPDQEAWVSEVYAEQLRIELTQSGHPILHVARPNFLDRNLREADQKIIDAVSAALIAAGDAVFTDEALAQRYLGAWMRTNPAAALFGIDPGYQQRMVIGRFDGVRSEAGLQILEYNGGIPGGLQSTEKSSRFMQSWPMFDEFAAAHPVAPQHVIEPAIRAGLAAWHEFGGSGLPVTVMAMPRELQDYARPYTDLLQATAEDIGAPFRICDPDELVRERGRLRFQGEPVDLVWRGFFTNMVEFLGTRLDGLMDAARAGEVCMVTSMRSGIYGHKALFALVTDPAVDLGLPPDQLSTARRHLPWTRVLAEGRTTDAEGDVVDLLDHVRRQRSQMVVKPVDGTGGAGVELGWEHTEDSWEKALANALTTGGYIAQQRLPLREELWPELAAGFPKSTFVSDHNPFVCSGAVAGYFVRLSRTGGLTNLTSGQGGVVPSFTLL